ncbi:hypothetical protein BOC60_20340 [Burkholderia pseudomallei]|nr:hypothetical protein BOC60_20340 [Burkholderia pseudomallei]
MQQRPAMMPMCSRSALLVFFTRDLIAALRAVLTPSGSGADFRDQVPRLSGVLRVSEERFIHLSMHKPTKLAM